MTSEDDLSQVAVTTLTMGLCYQFVGDPVRALESYDRLPSDMDDEKVALSKLIFRPVSLYQRGCLAEAERCARAALARPDFADDKDGVSSCVSFSIVWLGLLYRGLLEEGAAWLGDYRVDLAGDCLFLA